MIQLAEDIEADDSRKVPLDTSLRKVFIEVASNRLIDLAVVDGEQLRQFEKGKPDDDDWQEKVRNWEEVFELPADGSKRYLLFWNCNDSENAIVAYKITPIPGAVERGGCA